MNQVKPHPPRFLRWPGAIAPLCVGWLLSGGFTGCSNSPYPGADRELGTVNYRAFSVPPKDFDPQRSYTASDGEFLAMCYERLIGYRYLDRPLQLMPELALEVPEPEPLLDADGNPAGIRYRFEIHRGVHFIDDPCFPGGRGRELKASDFEYAFKRLADPKTNCPVASSFSHILGFSRFRERVEALREQRPDAASKPLYDDAGPMEGIRVWDDYGFDLILNDPYPQILYWLAMRFVCALPWEAVDYYDGRQGTHRNGEPLEFEQRPVGTGVYRFKWDEYNRDAKIVLVRNENWWGFGSPADPAPAIRYPSRPGELGDQETRAWLPERVGLPLAPIDRIEWRLEREGLSYFSKFTQGYYDAAAVPREMFSQVIEGSSLSLAMKAKGIRLAKDIGLDVFYIGFNMDDDDIGAPVRFQDPALEAQRDQVLTRNRRVRQAMSLAVDAEEFLRIFYKGLGVPAQSPIPPGIPGYDPGYRNPFRTPDPDLRRARRLMAEAGYRHGLDPATGEPLTLTFDVGSTDSRSRERYSFFVDAWKRLGINVQLAATDYNKFQQKMHAGSYQIFLWGWLADYPDPENFLFLLYGPNSSKYGDHKPNSARYEDPRYDFLFKQMETLPQGASRTWEARDPETGRVELVTRTRFEIIREMVSILERDCPWIPLQHSETYLLYHDWLTGVKPHPITGAYTRYYSLDKSLRAVKRREWNRPVYWPLGVLAAGGVAFLIPAYLSVRRNRR